MRYRLETSMNAHCNHISENPGPSHAPHDGTLPWMGVPHSGSAWALVRPSIPWRPRPRAFFSRDSTRGLTGVIDWSIISTGRRTCMAEQGTADPGPSAKTTTKATLIDVGTRLILEQGYHQTGIQDVLQAA